jgi:hypothetical protein
LVTPGTLQPLAHASAAFLQLRVIGAVAGHRVEDRIDVAEFVVDDRAEQAGRQLALHVGELLAQQIKQIRHVLGRRRILERDLHRGEARLGIGLHLVEIGQFLQLLLDRSATCICISAPSRPARSPRR